MGAKSEYLLEGTGGVRVEAMEPIVKDPYFFVM